MNTTDQKQSAATASAYKYWLKACRKDWLLNMLWDTATHNHCCFKSVWVARRSSWENDNRVKRVDATLSWKELSTLLDRRNDVASVVQSLATDLHAAFLNGRDSISMLWPDKSRKRSTTKMSGRYANIRLGSFPRWSPRHVRYENCAHVMDVAEIRAEFSKEYPDVLIAGDKLYKDCAQLFGTKNKTHFNYYGVDVFKEPLIPERAAYLFPRSSVELCFLTADKDTMSLEFDSSGLVIVAGLFYAIRFKRPGDFTKFMPAKKRKPI